MSLATGRPSRADAAVTFATNQVQVNLLFHAQAAKRDHSKLMEAMDKINERYSKATSADTLHWAHARQRRRVVDETGAVHAHMTPQAG